MHWYEANKTRFEIEKRLLAQFHPGTRIIIKNGKMKLEHRIAIGRNSYLVEGIFADNHPYSSMQFFVRQPSIRKSSPHRFCDGEICTHGPDDIGPETTAKVYLDWAGDWLRTYEKWLDGEPWPETNKD
jgi:hypothetical protein